MDKYLENFKYGIHIERAVFSENEVEELKKRFFSALDYCKEIREECGVESNMKNTVHHVLFLDEDFQKAIEKQKNIKSIDLFFEGKKFILNSIGGNNNIDTNYANTIHRDTRFYTKDKLMLNTIWCLSPINAETGGTEMMIGSENLEFRPTTEEFKEKAITINAKLGDIVYFDSRIWHRAGTPKSSVTERIIFTPIFSRPFIKPGFNYTKALKNSESNEHSEFIKQISSYYSDIPDDHHDWYNFNKRCFYQKEQDA